MTSWANTPTPIAPGARLFSRWDFREVIASGAVDIIQPDVSHAGGITVTRKIAMMAEAYDVALALHCPLGPIPLAACLQVDAGSYNAFIQEQSLGIQYNTSNDLRVPPSPVIRHVLSATQRSSTRSPPSVPRAD